MTTMTVDTVRPDVADAATLPDDPSAATLRDAVNMLKRYEVFTAVTLTREELAYSQRNFLVLIDAIATREGIDSGSLGYYLTNLAEQELGIEAFMGPEDPDGERFVAMPPNHEEA